MSFEFVRLANVDRNDSKHHSQLARDTNEVVGSAQTIKNRLSQNGYGRLPNHIMRWFVKTENVARFEGV